LVVEWGADHEVLLVQGWAWEFFQSVGLADTYLKS